MSDDSDEMPLTPAQWAAQLQEMSEGAAEQQMELFQQMLGAGTAGPSPFGETPFGQLGSVGLDAAVFKTRVQSGGRISIPDAERDALDIEEGDLVQAVVVPLNSGDQS